MKKIIITISFAIPILLSAAPAFATNFTYTRTPSGNPATAPVTMTVTCGTNCNIWTTGGTSFWIVTAQGTSNCVQRIVGPDTVSGPANLTLNSAAVGVHPYIYTYNDYSCNVFNDSRELETAFNITVAASPPPTPSINSGALSVPTSTTNDILASASNVFVDPGILGIVVIAMALPLVFWFAKEIVALNRQKTK